MATRCSAICLTLTGSAPRPCPGSVELDSSFCFCFSSFHHYRFISFLRNICTQCIFFVAILDFHRFFPFQIAPYLRIIAYNFVFCIRIIWCFQTSIPHWPTASAATKRTQGAASTLRFLPTIANVLVHRNEGLTIGLAQRCSRRADNMGIFDSYDFRGLRGHSFRIVIRCLSNEYFQADEVFLSIRIPWPGMIFSFFRTKSLFFLLVEIIRSESHLSQRPMYFKRVACATLFFCYLILRCHLCNTPTQGLLLKSTPTAAPAAGWGCWSSLKPSQSFCCGFLS